MEYLLFMIDRRLSVIDKSDNKRWEISFCKYVFVNLTSTVIVCFLNT